MSFDYLLFRAPSDGPMSSWRADEPAPLGTADELKALLEGLFPGVAWRPFQTSFFGTWQDGDRYADLQLTPSPSGRFSSISLKRIPREEVERVCRELGLVAVDPGGNLFRPGTEEWTREA